MMDWKTQHSGMCAQRYFHMLVFRETGRYSLRSFWEQLGDTEPSSGDSQITQPGVQAEFRRLVSERRCAGGAALAAASANSDGGPPFLYEVFALRAAAKPHRLFAFGFPYLGLAADVEGALRRLRAVPRSGKFVAAVVPGILQQCIAGIAPPGDAGLRVAMVGLKLIAAGGSILTHVTLGGDAPLDTDFFKQFVRPRVDDGTLIPNRCVLRCDMPSPSAGDPPPLRARVHMDSLGYFRFYVHAARANIGVVGPLLTGLQSLACLDTTSGPLRNQKIDDEELLWTE